MELLPYDTVEKILERVPVKSLVRFKSVSKQWKFIIESQYFQTKQLIFCKGKDLNLVLVSDELRTFVLPHHVTAPCATIKTNFLLKSSSLSSERYYYSLCHKSCDGLVCIYDYHRINIVFNPATRWSRCFPLSRLQQLCLRKHSSRGFWLTFGFGKDKITGTYKPVRLCNSSELGLENATTCEIFDFSTNTWRYITPSPYRINASSHPHALYLDGSLYWLTEEKETKVLSFDLHTETFQVISQAPFAVRFPWNWNMSICSLNNFLCVSVYIAPYQVIRSFNSENKTWEHIYTLVNLSSELSPLAILEKNRLLCLAPGYYYYSRPPVIYDPKTKSVDRVSIGSNYNGDLVSYVESLISIL